MLKAKVQIPPPKHILNAPTKVMKIWAMVTAISMIIIAPNQFSGQNYFPKGLEGSVYYNPLKKGFERKMKKRMAYWRNLKANK